MVRWRPPWPLTDWRRQTRGSLLVDRPTRPRERHKEDDAAHSEPLVPLSSIHETTVTWDRKYQTLPAYDKGLMTRNTCIGGLVFSWLVSIACITLAHWTFQSGQLFRTESGGYTHNGQGERVFFLSTVNQELVKLAVNVCISFCTDCLGYIHSASTRWALWREGRLLYNSNPRLLVSTRRCSSSRWSSNLVSAFLLMICYASSGQLFLPSRGAEQSGFVLNGIAVSALGIGILGQAIISTLCIWDSRKLIPTWSSNSLNTALTCLHHGMRSVDGRCMLSVHQTDCASVPSKPQHHQASAWRAIPSVRLITRSLWAFFALTVLWAIAIGSNPYFRKTSSTNLPLYSNSVPVLELNLCALLITTSLQTFLTLSLHLIELLVNLSRDEHIWRLATSKSGTQRSFGPLGSLKSAVCSWQTVLLFTLKSLAYWLFGLAVNSDGQNVYMSWAGILLLLAGIGVVVAFGSFLAWTQRSGPQPSTFGHLQTMVNMIDEWFEEGKNVWWGDKGVAKSTGLGGHQTFRHAGTAAVRLKAVQLNALYQ